MGIIADGAALEWKIDGVRICSVTETSCREGSIAHYTWDDWGIYVDDIVVADLDRNVVCLPLTWRLVTSPTGPSSRMVRQGWRGFDRQPVEGAGLR